MSSPPKTIAELTKAINDLNAQMLRCAESMRLAVEAQQKGFRFGSRLRRALNNVARKLSDLMMGKKKLPRD